MHKDKVKLPPEHSNTVDEYICTDPFMGDESELTCRTVEIRRARKPYLCFSHDGRQDHNIEPGQLYRYEQALVDGDFWGQYRICLHCMDKVIRGGTNEGEDDDGT